MTMEQLERKAIRLIETKAEDKPGTFSGYGAIFGNEDSHGDVIRQGAFSSTLKEWKDRGKWPPMLLQHGGGFFGGGARDMLPVGVWTSMEENSRGLKVEGQLFALSTEQGQYLYEGLKSGVLDGLSIGFQTRESITGTRPGEPDRILTNIDLWEVSIVTFPANPKARVTSVKGEPTKRDLEHALREAGFSRKAALTLVAKLDDEGAFVTDADWAAAAVAAGFKNLRRLVEAAEQNGGLQ
jgi:HK97 family phage prohead protease